MSLCKSEPMDSDLQFMMDIGISCLSGSFT